MVNIDSSASSTKICNFNKLSIACYFLLRQENNYTLDLVDNPEDSRSNLGIWFSELVAFLGTESLFSGWSEF